MAFHAAGHLAFEPRLTALFVAASGGHMYTLDPGLNILLGVPGSTHRDGGYFTAGADLVIMGSSGTTSRSYYTLNAGFGLRRPMGSQGASRAEIFFAVTPKQGTTVSEAIFAVGLRLGLSFFN